MVAKKIPKVLEIQDICLLISFQVKIDIYLHFCIQLASIFTKSAYSKAIVKFVFLKIANNLH